MVLPGAPPNLWLLGAFGRNVPGCKCLCLRGQPFMRPVHCMPALAMSACTLPSITRTIMPCSAFL